MREKARQPATWQNSPKIAFRELVSERNARQKRRRSGRGKEKHGETRSPLVVSGLVKHRARKDTEVLLVDEEDIYRVRK